MIDAHRLWRLQVAVGVFGAVTAIAALAVSITRIAFVPPSPAEIAAVCERWVFPHLDSGSVLVLGLGSVSVAVIVLSMRSAVRQVRRARRFDRSLRITGSLPAGDAPVGVIDAEGAQAFCLGFLRPRVYVSRRAVETLQEDELAAVLAHEAHHARRRDPLRILVARSLGDGLFFVPGVRRLAERCAALAELAADEAAVRSMRDSRPLASALLAFDSQPSATAVGIAPERVDHLLGVRPRWELPILLLAGALATVGALLAVTVRTATAAGHASVDLPTLAAQACMLAMAVSPLVVGSFLLIGGRRLVRRTAEG